MQILARFRDALSLDVGEVLEAAEGVVTGSTQRFWGSTQRTPLLSAVSDRLIRAFHVLRVFRSAGMACHLVQHHIATGGTGRDYRLTWCRTSSGEWKIKA
ncbi:MAG TPA: hypothetical protein VGR45_12395 [Stellaceae bacterium]|nr:hypothetical protein [Stellaceae bacterium]